MKVDPPGSTPNHARRSDLCQTQHTILNLLTRQPTLVVVARLLTLKKVTAERLQQ